MKETQEIWKSIKGFEGFYEISNLGNVRSIDRCISKGEHCYRMKGKPISVKVAKKGYLIVGLHKEGITRYVYIHRLVAEAFVLNPNNLKEVNHKDENKANNYASNLEWCTRKYNNAYGTRAQKHDRAVSKPVCSYTLEGELVATYPSITEASRAIGVLKSSVWSAIIGRSKTCKGLIWRYA